MFNPYMCQRVWSIPSLCSGVGNNALGNEHREGFHKITVHTNDSDVIVLAVTKINVWELWEVKPSDS